jgi:hypothetical protein
MYTVYTEPKGLTPALKTISDNAIKKRKAEEVGNGRRERERQKRNGKAEEEGHGKEGIGREGRR